MLKSPRKKQGAKKTLQFILSLGWITQEKPQWTPVLCLITVGFVSGKDLRNEKRIFTALYFLKR